MYDNFYVDLYKEYEFCVTFFAPTSNGLKGVEKENKKWFRPRFRLLFEALLTRGPKPPK